MTNGWIDIKNTDMMLIMGGNPAENHPCGFKWAIEAKIQRNAKTIVVDPRLTRTAATADLYLQIRAGADIAFLGGVINYALDNNRIARDYMGTHSGSLCGDQTCDAYFIHGLSHWLGMDVHDVGDYSTPFRPGMVLTIEPGIYLPQESLGVRIEDDVLVTPGGAEWLSGKAPRTTQEIERLMRGGR